MLHKSYVSEVVDPLSGHLANWHGSVELYYSFTPTANAESWAVEAFSLCMFLSSSKLSEWSPMERRAPAQGSS